MVVLRQTHQDDPIVVYYVPPSESVGFHQEFRTQFPGSEIQFDEEEAGGVIVTLRGEEAQAALRFLGGPTDDED